MQPQFDYIWQWMTKTNSVKIKTNANTMPKTLQAPVKSGPNFAAGHPQIPFFLSAAIQITDRNTLIMSKGVWTFEFEKAKVNELNVKWDNKTNENTHITLWKTTDVGGNFWYLVEKRNKSGDTPLWERELEQSAAYTKQFYGNCLHLKNAFVLPTRTDWKNTEILPDCTAHEANSILTFVAEANLLSVTADWVLKYINPDYNLLLLQCLFKACIFMEYNFQNSMCGFICDIKHDNIVVAHTDTSSSDFYESKDTLNYWQAFLIDLTIVPSKLPDRIDQQDRIKLCFVVGYDAPITNALQYWLSEADSALTFFQSLKEMQEHRTEFRNTEFFDGIDLSRYYRNNSCVADQDKVNLLRLLYNFEHTIRVFYNCRDCKNESNSDTEPTNRLLAAWGIHTRRLEKMIEYLMNNVHQGETEDSVLFHENMYIYHKETFWEILNIFHEFSKKVVAYFLLDSVYTRTYTEPNQTITYKGNPVFQKFHALFPDLKEAVERRDYWIGSQMYENEKGNVTKIGRLYRTWSQTSCRDLLSDGNRQLHACLEIVDKALQKSASQPLFPRQFSFIPPDTHDEDGNDPLADSQFFAELSGLSGSKIRVATLPDSKNPNKVLWSAWNADIHDGKEHLKSLLQGRATHSDVILRSADSETEIKQIIDLVGRL